MCNLLVSRFMEDVNKRQQFLDTVLHISFRINIQKKIPQHLTN